MNKEREDFMKEMNQRKYPIFGDDVWLDAHVFNTRCSFYYNEGMISYNQLRYLKCILVKIQKKDSPNYEAINNKIFQIYEMVENQCLIDHRKVKDD